MARRVLVASSRPGVKDAVAEGLGPSAAVYAAVDGSELSREWDLIVADVELFRETGRSAQAYRALLGAGGGLARPLVVVVAPSEGALEAVELVNAGADSYLTHPLEAVEVRLAAQSLFAARKRESELAYLREQVAVADPLGIARPASRAMRAVLDQAALVAPTRSTVLITGESGTGKGVMARMIHRLSNRKNGPFIAVGCAGLPESLIESELFGHEKGAFTGAHRRRLGKFELASGGTIFLDEIGTLSPRVQIKLLQVLQERTFSRVGGEREIASDARVVAATNENLAALVAAGTFREDLYYRLHVFPIEVPPLRERVEDVAPLAEHFLKRHGAGREQAAIDPRALAALGEYHWPGNVRELENLVERAVILAFGETVGPEHFPAEVMASVAAAAPRSRAPAKAADTGRPLAEVRKDAVAEVERAYLAEMLETTHGKVAEAAARAGITPRQLRNLMRKLGLDKSDFKS